MKPLKISDVTSTAYNYWFFLLYSQVKMDNPTWHPADKRLAVSVIYSKIRENLQKTFLEVFCLEEYDTVQWLRA